MTFGELKQGDKFVVTKYCSNNVRTLLLLSVDVYTKIHPVEIGGVSFNTVGPEGLVVKFAKDTIVMKLRF